VQHSINPDAHLRQKLPIRGRLGPAKAILQFLFDCVHVREKKIIEPADIDSVAFSHRLKLGDQLCNVPGVTLDLPHDAKVLSW